MLMGDISRMSITTQTMKWLIFVLFCWKIVLGDDKIIGGMPAVPHSQPHVVHLDRPSFFCGGSLIDPKWVLSAAHCYQDVSSFYVVLGDHDFTKDEGSEQLIYPSMVIPHPRYDSYTKENDIMLIKLRNPAKINKFVQSTSLPERMNEPPEGISCTICGWGNQYAAGNVYPEVLRCVESPVASTNQCNDVTSYNGLIRDSMFCIGDMNGGKDACDGDSGGPAICGGTLLGVVSWGYGCGYPNFPGVYVKVSWFIDWIETTMTYN